MEVPRTRYARVGDDRIAYQVFGEGPVDLVYLSSMGSDCIDLRWDYPPYVAFLQRLATFCRVITFDPRGSGASERVELTTMPSWEQWADDARGVLDAAGSQRVAVFGANDAGVIAMLFAATQPDRTRALILGNACARFSPAPDYPWGIAEESADGIIAGLEDTFGTDDFAAMSNPSEGDAYDRWSAKSCRLSSGPRAYAAYVRSLRSIDVRETLSSIRVPTLVIHRRDAPLITPDQGRDVAARILGARFVEVPGDGTAMWTKPNSAILDEIEEFLTGVSPRTATDRVLAAILFTDIVGSTERAASLGDRRWRTLLESHDAVTRAIADEHGASLVKSTGDGALITFGGPGRAIRCAFALREALQPLGVSIRAGLHTGEIERRDGDVGGIAVHVAARVIEHAEAGEVLVSAAVPLLVAGSGLEFEERGDRELKGVPGTWKLFAVQD